MEAVMFKPRRLALALTVATVAFCAIPAGVGNATSVKHQPAPNAHAASTKGWVCTLTGAVVAAGVGALTAGITGVLAGGAFTAGCELAVESKKPEVISGLPNVPKNCWYNFRYVKRVHRKTGKRYYKRIHEVWCYA